MNIPGGDELNAQLGQLKDVSNVESCWRVSNRYNAAAACPNCTEIVRHADWCPAVNEVTLYAHECVIDPHLMVEADHIVLHGLGVSWGNCERKYLV